MWWVRGKEEAPELLSCSPVPDSSPPITDLVLHWSLPQTLRSRPNSPTYDLNLVPKSKRVRKKLKKYKIKRKRKVRQVGDKRTPRKRKTPLNT